jgi:hypothetical protein
MNLNVRQAAKPRKPLAAERFTGGNRHLLNRSKQGLQLRRLIPKLFPRLRPEKHFIGIANHALPAEFANAIYYLYRARSAVGQMATVNNHIRGGLPQVR